MRAIELLRMLQFVTTARDVNYYWWLKEQIGIRYTKLSERFIKPREDFINSQLCALFREMVACTVGPMCSCLSDALHHSRLPKLLGNHKVIFLAPPLLL